MRQVGFVVIAVLIILSVVASPADALSDASLKKTLTSMVVSYYDNDADTLWKMTSKFEKSQLGDLAEIKRWMKDRMALQPNVFKVKGIIVQGMAKITNEKLGEITFRFDGSENAPSRVVVVTAHVDRVIVFDPPVVEEHRIVDQEAYLKIYATLIKEKLVSFKSDELNFGYSFDSEKKSAGKKNTKKESWREWFKNLFR